MYRPVDIPSDCTALPSQLTERYRLVRVLGAGPSGRVYLVEDLASSLQVVVKVLHREITQNLAVREALESELFKLQKLIHPALARILDWGDVDDDVHIVSEYVAGKSLAQLLPQGQAAEYPIETIVSDVGGALEALHSHGVVHGNVKPSNIICLADGSVKLTDAAAWRCKLHDGDPRRTSFIACHYAAPEQRDTAGSMTPASDVYSLGMVAFKVLTGRTPSTLGGVDPRQANRSIPRWVGALVFQMTQQDPNERVQSMSDVLAVFEDAPKDRTKLRALRFPITLPTFSIPLSPAYWFRCFDTMLATIWGQVSTMVMVFALVTTCFATAGLVSLTEVARFLIGLIRGF